MSSARCKICLRIDFLQMSLRAAVFSHHTAHVGILLATILLQVNWEMFSVVERLLHFFFGTCYRQQPKKMVFRFIVSNLATVV